ncbi:MAG: IS200/IS605 family element transposase accessory protein TnpB [Candidatus Methanomethyliales bacterium]|nr:IS200/IS605 family element transposase accessory protein TnpB [Candidatus Methanomethylicales archaeon]
MELPKTVVCKLKPTPEESEKLLATLKAFKDACNYISKVAFERKVFNPVALHHMVYRETRQMFKLPANLAIRARDRVAKAYKLRRDTLLQFKALSMDLDERIFRLIYKPERIFASISTLQKRVKPPLDIGEYQRRLLEDAKPTHAVLVYRNNKFFLHITVTKEIPEPKGNNPVGVDVGMKNLLAASNGFKVKGGETLRKRHHFRGLRSSLQAKGTASAKRSLKRLSRRERRWVNTILHQVSRAFVNSLKEGDIVVMEKLTGIRNNAKHRKSQNGDFHSWAFRRLQSFIEYKSLERGVPVVYVEPRNTSITCPRCGHVDKANRKSQSLFRCTKCGFQHNADYVASLNLSRLELAPPGRAPVNEPNAGMNGDFKMNHYDSPASPQASAVGS